MIVILALPEWRICYSDYSVGAVRRGDFQPSHDFWERFVRLDDDVYVVRHYYPSGKVVRASPAVAVAQRADEHSCDPGVSQPHWSELESVELVIEVGKSFAGIWIALQELDWRYWGGSGKTPGYENWLAFGSVVR